MKKMLAALAVFAFLGASNISYAGTTVLARREVPAADIKTQEDLDKIVDEVYDSGGKHECVVKALKEKRNLPAKLRIEPGADKFVFTISSDGCDGEK